MRYQAEPGNEYNHLGLLYNLNPQQLTPDSFEGYYKLYCRKSASLPDLRYQEEPGNEYNSPRNVRAAHPRN